MPAPLRGTQSLVGQMGWVFERPSLTVLEIAWRWIFGLPFLAVCWIAGAADSRRAAARGRGPHRPRSAESLAGRRAMSNAWALYQPHVSAVLRWLLPAAALAWVIVSGLGPQLWFSSAWSPACASARWR